MSFKNKVVIVTGASSGIGATTAVFFAKEGADVAIVGRNETKLNQVASEISKLGKSALILKADITNDEEAKQVILRTVGKFKKIDVLVNNAGLFVNSEVGENNFINAYDKIFNTNLRAVAVLTNYAVPHLKKFKGNIVNVSSVAGRSTCGDGGFGLSTYCASKAALDQLSRNCATELAEFGVRVNIVAPGPVKTSFLEAGGYETANYEGIAEVSTALKILTQPEEVSEVILFLASDKARAVTGSVYGIDAGFLVNEKRLPIK